MTLPNVRVLGHEVVDLDTPEGRARFREINKNAIENKFEGIMVKEPKAPYECDRTDSWLKLKPFIEVTLTATQIEEGTGKHEGRMGAVVFEGTDEGKDISVSVGSGFTDQERAIIWANYSNKPSSWTKKVKGVLTDFVEYPDSNGSVIGQLGEVRADAISQNQNGTYSLRFPRFKTWRGFDKGEKL
jgi:DNA ligase-1